jgi:hypothetical protein
VEEYKYFGIHSVEQLANASDSVGQRFPGFYGDRDKAKAFIEAASGHNARIAELERQLSEMQAKMQAPAQIAAPAVASAAEAASEPVAALAPVPKTVIKGK